MSCTKKKMALVHDPHFLFKNPEKAGLPHDASAEWESPDTVQKIVDTWTALGFEVTTLSPSPNFFETWARDFRKFDLVHSVIEGWGNLGREAWVPALCEFSGVPFVGSGSFTMATSMKKSLVKSLCRTLGIATPRGFVVTAVSDLHKIPNDFFTNPHFLKPDGEGSGMGVDESISISSDFQKTKGLVEDLLKRFPEGVLIEERLTGREYTTALLGHPARFLPIAEIEVPTGVYGLANKSKDYMGEKVTFPQLPQDEVDVFEQATRSLWNALGCCDFARMDFMKHDGKIYFLEVNPLAGLSYHYSVLPKMAEAAGLSYVELFDTIAKSALERSKHSRALTYGKTCFKGPCQLA